MSRLLRLSDDQWRRTEPLLSPERATGGRPAKPHRPIVEAMIWMLRTSPVEGPATVLRPMAERLHAVHPLVEVGRAAATAQWAGRLDALEDVLSGYVDVYEYVHVHVDEDVHVGPASPGWFEDTP